MSVQIAEFLIEVPALGCIGELGEIYDAKTNRFVGLNGLNKPLPITSISNANKSSKYSSATKEYEKLDVLDIKADIKLSALCGMLDFNGSAKYIKNCNIKEKFTQCSYILQTKTCKERIIGSLLGDEFEDAINFEGIKRIDGTHIVVGTQYGGNAVVTLQSASNDIKNSLEIQGILEAALTGTLKTDEKISYSKLNVIIEADTNMERSIKTPEEVKEFTDSFMQNLKDCNNGKGIPVAYELLPIQLLFEFRGQECDPRNSYKGLSGEVTSKMSNLIYDAEKVKEELNEHFSKINVKNFVDKDKNWLKKEKQLIENCIFGMRDRIIEIKRSFHVENPKANEQLQQEIQRIEELQNNLSAFKKSCNKFILKSYFVEVAEKANVRYIFDETEFAKLKLEDKPLYICFYSESNYKNHLNLLKYFIKLKSVFSVYCINVIVDADALCDFIMQELNVDQLPSYPLYFYENGKYFKSDETTTLDRPLQEIHYNIYQMESPLANILKRNEQNFSQIDGGSLFLLSYAKSAIYGKRIEQNKHAKYVVGNTESPDSGGGMLSFYPKRHAANASKNQVLAKVTVNPEINDDPPGFSNKDNVSKKVKFGNRIIPSVTYIVIKPSNEILGSFSIYSMLDEKIKPITSIFPIGCNNSLIVSSKSKVVNDKIGKIWD